MYSFESAKHVRRGQGLSLNVVKCTLTTNLLLSFGIVFDPAIRIPSIAIEVQILRWEFPITWPFKAQSICVQ